MNIRNSILAVSVLLGVSVVAADPPPELVLLNGKVFTSASTKSSAEAIAIRGERIVAVDTSDKIKALAGPNTRRLDLQGRVVVPGFNDAHFHHVPRSPGTHLKLKFPEPAWTEVLDALAEAVKQAPAGTWIFGQVGGVVVNDSQATRTALDRVAPEHPVLIQSWFGHGHVINSRAMPLLAVRDDEPDPLGGIFEREPVTSRITGKFFEYAGWGPFRRLTDNASDEQIVASMRAMAGEAVRFGVTSIQNMTFVSPERYVTLLRQAQLPLRVRVIRWPPTDTRGRDLKDGRSLPRHPPGVPLVTVSGTKWILDGTPIERGMAVRAPYLDRSAWRGSLLFSPASVEAMLRESIANQDPVLFHAVGDRAIDTVLTAMEALDTDGNWRSRRVRIEHGDGLLADLVPRARRLGVIIVQNPTHFDPKLTSVVDRFGPNHQFFPLRSLLKAGIPLAIGSDGPMNPGLNIMLATIHPARPDEAITRQQAVEAYTRGSAYAEFAEGDKGTIEPGKLADLAVLSQDIFQVPLPELPRTQSVLTLVGGNVVFDAGAIRPPPPSRAP
jgi:predicted amidohydrolase YtcJ